MARPTVATSTAARPNVRRLAALGLAAILALSVMAAMPAGAAAVAVVPDGCSAVTISSPGPLAVHVSAADCGDPTDTGFFAGAELSQDSTGEIITTWGWSPLGGRAGTWIDETIAVPAQGGYTLTITGNPTVGVPFPTPYKVTALGGVLVTVSHPVLRFRPGAMTSGSWPAVVKWSDTSNNAVFDYLVRTNVDGVWGAWKPVVANQYKLRVSRGHTYQFQVRGRNLQKVAGPPMASIVYRPKAHSEANARITYTGTWKYSLNSRHWGGRTKFATRAGATARFTFTGTAAAIVAPLGPRRGSFRVYADGFYQRTVKTYSSGAGYKYVVYAIAWPQVGTHTLTIRVNGTAGHPRVDLDGILTLE